MTKAEVKVFHNELLEAVEKVYKKYGLSDTGNTVRYGDTDFKITLNAQKVGADGKRQITEADERWTKRVLLQAGYNVLSKDISILGSKVDIHSGLGTVTITGVKPSRYKYPFTVETANGTAYKIVSRPDW